MQHRVATCGWALAPILAALSLVWVSACRTDAPEETSAAVATVGGETIPARDFELSYELGFPHLKQGSTPALAYLQRMIDEKLLALEGYRQGLHRTAKVQRQVEDLREELLVEQVFEQEVNDKVVVTDEEIRRAMQKDQVQFKLRYLPAADLEQAERLRDEVLADGFDAAIDRYLAANPEARFQREDFASPYVTWQDMDPALLEAISNLPVGELSNPIPFRGSYIIVEVLDIRREPAGSLSNPEERAQYEQVLFQRKAKEEARRFIGETMQPLDLRIKAQPYRTLREHLWAWYRDAPPPSNLRSAIEASEGSHADALRKLMPELLMTTREGDWTVGDFLDAFPTTRYPLSTKSEAAFQSDLHDGIGLVLRDRLFARRAEAGQLGERPEVQEELKRWTDKWVYRALLDRMADTIRVEEDDLRTYFERHRSHYTSGQDLTLDAVRDEVRSDVQAAKLRSRLPAYLASLHERYGVTIHRDVLDTMSVGQPAGSPGPFVLLTKGHTQRAAFPIVDPVW